MFDTIIVKRFEEQPGYKMVQRRQFAIEDDLTGREASRSFGWSICLRPGQKINMTMIFPDSDANSTSCPGCGTESAASTEDRIQWYFK
jgi:hypothetical protein